MKLNKMGTYNHIHLELKEVEKKFRPNRFKDKIIVIETKLSEYDVIEAQEEWAILKNELMDEELLLDDKHQTKYTVSEISLMKMITNKMSLLFSTYFTDTFLVLSLLDRGYEVKKVISEYNEEEDIIKNDKYILL
ncbi:MAG: hypothetical protein ACQESN_08705 [Thermotogota bacterium]